MYQVIILYMGMFGGMGGAEKFRGGMRDSPKRKPDGEVDGGSNIENATTAADILRPARDLWNARSAVKAERADAEHSREALERKLREMALRDNEEPSLEELRTAAKRVRSELDTLAPQENAKMEAFLVAFIPPAGFHPFNGMEGEKYDWREHLPLRAKKFVEFFNGTPGYALKLVTEHTKDKNLTILWYEVHVALS